ncbi:hypothetical protein F7018_02145 [Tenacibaculum aiptasiae]|uniref:Lantibiotic dehydratase N-terminal domain-containing protein n=1 Tax=Tenacibaculum aiptasiae TaxID=426481 RepID=A0A7J5AT19_9FLAO|nr:lantibiotic dehydratase family protein [Tenacibaculum aiptasiae]KAB1160699.1 hypothetical protein F7018_02145 [Tenacibaculum aiptasiae]
MNKKNPYKNFKNYVLRNPMFSINIFKEFTSKEDIYIDDYKRLWTNPIIKEAFFLASPMLTNEITKWLNEGVNDNKKEEKLKYTFLKYISRMSSRCTPFGLFAGCSVGVFDDKTEIKITKAFENSRHTRLDMNYLVALSQDLIKNETIKKQLLFFPNSSIYEIGDRLRYTEYKYVKGKRFHQVAEVDNTEYLRKILLKSREGILLSNIAEDLLIYDITIEEAIVFVNQLVDSQILISELEPSVSGPEFFDQIYNTLRKLKDIDEIVSVLKEVDKHIQEIDNKVGNKIDKYIEISEKLKELKTDFDIKYLFQTDLVINTTVNKIDEKVIRDIKKGMLFLSKLNIKKTEDELSKFKDAFYERYEDEEVKLSTALDVEIGVGYIQNNRIGDISPLIDDLIIPSKFSKKIDREIKWNTVYEKFQKKILQALKEDKYIIKLTDDDFKEFETNLDNLPDTLSTMIEIVGDGKIRMYGSGGSSSANILGRFCHSDNQIKTYTEEIVHVEEIINKDKILAEIVHLPESRIGNILCRPDFRSYEIPYLAKSVKNSDKKILLEDLVISSKSRGKIKLKSKKHNKEVLPRLTTAHNYRSNSLPIYHFLSDMQTQGMMNGLGIDLGPIINEYEFIPRIEYENLILKEATWNLKNSHIEQLLEEIDNKEILINKVKHFTKKLKLPKFVKLADGDNQLLINLENITSIRMFLNTVKNRSNIKLIEFLFDNEKSIVDLENKAFTNEIIVSFFNESKLKESERK